MSPETKLTLVVIAVWSLAMAAIAGGAAYLITNTLTHGGC